MENENLFWSAEVDVASEYIMRLIAFDGTLSCAEIQKRILDKVIQLVAEYEPSRMLFYSEHSCEARVHDKVKLISGKINAC